MTPDHGNCYPLITSTATDDNDEEVLALICDSPVDWALWMAVIQQAGREQWRLELYE